MLKISVITPTIRPQYLDITKKCLEEQTFSDFEWLIEPGLTRWGYTLPKDWNKLLKRCQGEIIVMLQDCIKVDKDFLQRVCDLHTQSPDTLFTYPVGKVNDFSENPKWDWRHFFDRREIKPFEWEIDLGSAPKQAFYDVGGFDEEFCNGWSWENCEIAYRINATGKYKFEVEPKIEGIAIDHDVKQSDSFRNKLPNNDKRARETEMKANRGDYKLHYLS